eukprot:GCRY01002068.1.p1 GENE.GCRY01002068.1~~GCRY01002068.1.p1  ORF type:complete len:220 (+),score=15.74 GCRY01002068.1:146-805(+)
MRSRFFHYYYILNVFAIVSFLFWLDNLPSHFTTFLSLLAIFALRLKIIVHIDTWVAEIFKYSKIFVLYLAYKQDSTLFGCYAGLFLVLLLCVRQPFYKGPSFVQELHKDDFDMKIKESKHVLLECYVVWAPDCAQTSHSFAQLSLVHASNDFTFFRINLDKYRDIAEKLNISVSSSSKQLPTYIEFVSGKEIKRIPTINSKKKMTNLSATLGKHFGLGQ